MAGKDNTIALLQARVEELERRLRDLEARPVYVPYNPVPYYPAPPYPAYPWGPIWVGDLPAGQTTGGSITTTSVTVTDDAPMWASSGYAQPLHG